MLSTTRKRTPHSRARRIRTSRALFEAPEPRQLLSTTLYDFNFDQPKDGSGHFVPEMNPWSYRTTTTAPNGQVFLGNLGGTQSASLTLHSVPVGQLVTVEFDLYVIGGWSGNSTQRVYNNTNMTLYGADQWSLTANGSSLINTTFSNTPTDPNLGDRALQGWSSPDSQTGSVAAQTGATAVNSLGYTYAYSYLDSAGHSHTMSAVAADSVYHITETFENTSSNLVLTFAGNLTNTITQNSWGLDNVKVTVPSLDHATVTDNAPGADGASFTATDSSGVTGNLLIHSDGSASINISAPADPVAAQSNVAYQVVDLTTSTQLAAGTLPSVSSDVSLAGINSGDQVQVQTWLDDGNGSLDAGENGSLKTVTLAAKEFTLHATPATNTVTAGQSVDFLVWVTDADGGKTTEKLPTATVTKVGGGAATGVTVNIPDTVNTDGEYTATIHANAGTAGTYTITIQLAGADDITVNLTVNP